MGVLANLGAKINTRKRAVRIDPDVMEDVSTKQGNKRDWVSLKVGDMGDEAEEVMFDEFLLWDPELLSAIVDDCVLMGVSVNGEGTGGGHGRGWGRGLLQVPLGVEVLQVRVDVIRRREMGRWQRARQQRAAVGRQLGCPQGQCGFKDFLQRFA